MRIVPVTLYKQAWLGKLFEDVQPIVRVSPGPPSLFW